MPDYLTTHITSPLEEVPAELCQPPSWIFQTQLRHRRIWQSKQSEGKVEVTNKIALTSTVTRSHSTLGSVTSIGPQFNKSDVDKRIGKNWTAKTAKMPQKHMEFFRLLFGHLPWIEHQFLSGIRASRKAGSLWGMMRGVGGVRKSIHQSWLAKGLGLGLELLCWGQEEIPSEEASTL